VGLQSNFPRAAVALAILSSVLFLGNGARAQDSALPPGTTSPDDSSLDASRVARLLGPAEDAILRGDYGKALPLLNTVLARQPANARALYDRGYVETQQNQMEAAVADFRKANAADPKQFESHAELGRVLAQQGHWAQARQQLQTAAVLPPASGDPRQALGSVFRTLARVDQQLNDPAAASDALLAALKITPEQPDDTLLAAQLAESQGDHDGAIAAYRRVLAVDPASVQAASGLARILIHQGKFAEAEPVVRQALQQQPNDPDLMAEQATALAGEGKTADAIAQLEALHRQNPNQSAVTRMLADLYSTAGQATQAEPLYRELVASDGKNAELLTAQGENLIREQKWQAAIDALQRSLALQPEQADAWSSLAFAASEDREYPLVLQALDHRAQYLQDGPSTLFLRATALDHLQRTREAMHYYRQFLQQAQGKFPNEEAETRQRLLTLERAH
jgi:tetratricopeptide (TPR) repeat protein